MKPFGTLEMKCTTYERRISFSGKQLHGEDKKYVLLKGLKSEFRVKKMHELDGYKKLWSEALKCVVHVYN